MQSSQLRCVESTSRDVISDEKKSISRVKMGNIAIDTHTGKTVSVNALESTGTYSRYKFKCTECNGYVFPKIGGKRRWHFRHFNLLDHIRYMDDMMRDMPSASTTSVPVPSIYVSSGSVGVGVITNDAQKMVDDGKMAAAVHMRQGGTRTRVSDDERSVGRCLGCTKWVYNNTNKTVVSCKLSASEWKRMHDTAGSTPQAAAYAVDESYNTALSCEACCIACPCCKEACFVDLLARDGVCFECGKNLGVKVG